jgi:acetyltransferase-like isoleucine patch superfamily enzyme
MDTSRLIRGFKDPIKSCNYARLVLKGHYYKFKYKLLGKNVQIGANFKVKRSLSIKGPGRVIMGDNVYVDGTSHTVTPWTSHKEAEIIIGNNVFLNGTRFGCARRIEIGDNCIVADCRILDTDFHSVYPNRRNDPDYIESSPIIIGKNVWIALGCVILRGVRIGDNSTISAQSVVYKDVPENCVYGGNPAVFIRKISTKNNL